MTIDVLQRVLSSPPHRGRFQDDVLEDEDLTSVRRELETAWLRKRFLAVDGNMSALAEKIGLARLSLYTWFARLGVNPDLWREEMAREGRTPPQRGGKGE